MKELENTVEIVGGDGEAATMAAAIALVAGVVGSGGVLGVALIVGAFEFWE